MSDRLQREKFKKFKKFTSRGQLNSVMNTVIREYSTVSWTREVLQWIARFGVRGGVSPIDLYTCTGQCIFSTIEFNTYERYEVIAPGKRSLLLYVA